MLLNQLEAVTPMLRKTCDRRSPAYTPWTLSVQDPAAVAAAAKAALCLSVAIELNKH
jgi:hypothetical protein